MAAHLMNVVENDHVHIHELRGFNCDDLDGAFHEIYAVSRGTRCQKFLYSLSLSPPSTEDVSVEAFEVAIEEIEHKLGFVGQPRAVVFHEKKCRRHAHVVWSRIDSSTMTAIDPYQDKLTLEGIAHNLFIQHGWELPEGFKRKEDADPLNYSHSEHQQAKRTKRDPKELKRIFADAWQLSDSTKAFEHALAEQGLILARGDLRGFVAVDINGEVYSLTRWIGVKSKEVRAKLGNPAQLPSAEEALTWFKESGAEQGQADDPNSAKHSDAVAALECRRVAMVERHRQLRSELSGHHEQRRIQETTSRAAKLPRGLKAAWLVLSGRYDALVRQLEEEANECAARDRTEMQELIQSQLVERRALQREFDDLGYDPNHAIPVYGSDPAQSLILPPDQDIAGIKAKVRQNPIHILEVITDKKEHFTRNDLIYELLNYINDPFAVKAAVDRIEKSSELTLLGSKPVPEFTTRKMQKAKEALSDHAESLSKLKDRGVSGRHKNAAIKAQNKRLKEQTGFDLSQEQKDAINHCLGAEHIAAVVGLAGAGKSTMLSGVKEGYERAGYNVFGAALSGKAADGLESASSIPSRTLASYEHSWKSGFKKLTNNDVLIIDEAGMIGTKQFLRFVEVVKDTGAKLIVVGDPDQLQPINAGAPFRETINQIGAARLTEIHRQKEDWQKQASLNLAEGRIEQALDAYEARGHVVETRNTETAISKLVYDYVRDAKDSSDPPSRLALTYRRKDVYAINQGIREAMKANGKLANEVMFKTVTGKRAFAAGDQILLTRNERSLGVRNGMFGTVRAVSTDKIVIDIDGDDSQNSRCVTINTSGYENFEHGYASTIHKSQGATVDRTYVLGSVLMDRHLTYVAMTRHKQDATLYGDHTSFHKMRRLGMSEVHTYNRSRSHSPRRGPTIN